MTDIDDFFKDGPSVYTKFEKDTTTKLRVVSDIIIGWEGWYNNKPVRFPANYQMSSKEKNTLDVDDNNMPKLKQFMACLVWNYNESAPQIWSITQKSIIRPLMNLRTDPDWGGLTKHDIKVKRTGSGFETKYELMPAPGELPGDAEVKIKESGLEAGQILSDQKILENNENFRKAAGIDDIVEEKEISPDDIPF